MSISTASTIIVPELSNSSCTVSQDHENELLSLSSCSGNNVPDTNTLIHDSKQTTMKMFTITNATKMKLDKILAYAVAIDMMPYSVVDREGFKLYTQALCPSYKLPSRKTLTDKRIPDLYKETKKVVENILSNLTFFALTTDCWTSISNKPFIALTCHYLNADFKLGNLVKTHLYFIC